MRKRLALLVAVIGLAVAAAQPAWANKALPPPTPPPTPKPPASQPATQPSATPSAPGKAAAWSRAGGVTLGLGAAALLAAGGLYLSRRRGD